MAICRVVVFAGSSFNRRKLSDFHTRGKTPTRERKKKRNTRLQEVTHMGAAFHDYCMPYSLSSSANPDFYTRDRNHLRATCSCCLVSRVHEKPLLFFIRVPSSFLLHLLLTDQYILAADNAGCINRDCGKAPLSTVHAGRRVRIDLG